MGLVCMVIVALAASVTGGEGVDAIDSRNQIPTMAVASSNTAQASPSTDVERAASSAVVGEDVKMVVLACDPVAAYWTGPPQSDGMPQGPSLAIVSVHARPKDARVHLDDRFVGRARYLDGKPGYLYLEPGAYRLELRFEGYQTVMIALEASAGCKYSLKHYMERIKGAKKSKKADTFGKGMPFERVFGPQTEREERIASTAQTGPDLRLRGDFDSSHDDAKTTAGTRGASLRLSVAPESATVTLDGVFVATAWELSLMEGPLATTAGPHLIEVRAEGFVDASRRVDLEAGEELAVQILLSEEGTD
jgi:hypothetical protein